MQIIFLFKESCLTVAILLHYFFMAAFCWMLSEGVLLFIMLYFVFYKGFFKRKRFYFAIGWGKKNIKIHIHMCLWLTTLHIWSILCVVCLNNNVPYSGKFWCFRCFPAKPSKFNPSMFKVIQGLVKDSNHP